MFLEAAPADKKLRASRAGCVADHLCSGPASSSGGRGEKASVRGALQLVAPCLDQPVRPRA